MSVRASSPSGRPPAKYAAQIELQRQMAASIDRVDRFGSLRHVAGVDVAYGRRHGPARAAAVVLALPTLQLIEQQRIALATSFPYVPGLLSFREAPAAIAAIRALQIKPDILMCDGHGIAHPRRVGFASHVGVELDLPSIGVAKSRLIGTHAEPGNARGDWTPLIDSGEVIGAVLRTRPFVKPVFVSIGHRVSLPTSIEVVLACTTGYRLPEPTRLADKLSRQELRW